MQTQFSLPGFDPDPSESAGQPRPAAANANYSLFLALFPAPADADRIARRIGRLRDQFGLAGEPLRTERLHITLHSLGSYVDTVPEPLIAQIIAAAQTVVCPPVGVIFDHAMSFAGSGAFVLCADENPAVDLLRQRLAIVLERAGLRHHPSSKPHMTALYDRRQITPHGIEPIRWVATEFVLILSHLRKKHHQWLARWPLTETL